MKKAKWRKNVISLAKRFCHSRFQTVFFAVIDMAESTNANHGFVRKCPAMKFTLLISFKNIG
jgi:hypothetical protein